MIKEEKFNIRLAQKEDRSNIAHLIQFESFVHKHLDWRPPLDWIGHNPYIIAEKNNRVLCALACPPDPIEISWIRVFAATGKIGGNKAWEILWPKAKEALIEQGIKTALAIPLHDWFKKLLINKNFTEIHKVVVLVWDSVPLSTFTKNSNYKIRPFLPKDIERIQQIDEKAFGPIWRISRETLSLAYEQALIASVVETIDGVIVGYQISTNSPLGAHLSRLAVLPEMQGMGIGYMLIRHVQSMFEDKLSARVTVNTQDNNFASLGLYIKAGFKLTGEKYPVFQLDLSI